MKRTPPAPRLRTRASWPDAERAEALAVALADPADALISLRALVALEKLPRELELLP
jgi:hypothetical protein